MRIKPIPHFDGYYIREDGVVISTKGQGSKTINNKPRALKGREANNGYLRVYMRDSRDNKRKDRFIHRLVAQAFIPNPENKKVVNHKDSNRKNNHVSNLEWVTHKENNKDTMKKGHVVRCSETGRFKSGLME